MPDITVPWWPQPRQAELIRAAGLLDTLRTGAPPQKPQARVIGYGGAAGGGKTDADLGLAFTWAAAYPGSQIAFFRRTFTELEGPDGAIQRAHELLAPLRRAGAAKWNGDNHRWTFAWGSVLQFCHCQTAKDVFNYQSARFDLLLIDEATHFPWPMVDYLMTRNGPTVDSVLQPLAVFTTNPGNVGHGWYKTQFVDVRPWGQPHDVLLPSGEPERHMFILAKLDDNPILDRRASGEYRQTLKKRDPVTKQALLDADWNIFMGQVFKEWREDRHIIKPMELPAHHPRFMGIDWGYASPFAAYWRAKDPDTGRVYVYREAYDVGLTDRRQARLIRDMTPPLEKIRHRYADPSMWTKRNQEDMTFSTADEYAAEGVYLTRADNDRLTRVRKLHTLLADLPDGRPGLLVFQTCVELIRTLPALVADPIRPEDVDTDGEDHAYDALTYSLTPDRPVPPGKDKVLVVHDPLLGRARRSGDGLGSRDL